MKAIHATHFWVSAGSVVTAIIASACCWLPLLLVVFGVSAGGLSVVFEKARPFFLFASPVLLGFGFYLNYFRKPRCAAGECVTSNPRAQRLSRSVLWVATIAVVAFAFFPAYSGALFPGSDEAVAAHAERVILDVDGMTCEGCAVSVRTTLKNVPGVIDAVVSYTDKRAVVILDEESPPKTSTLIGAIKWAGYQAAEGVDTLATGVGGVSESQDSPPTP